MSEMIRSYPTTEAAEAIIDILQCRLDIALEALKGIEDWSHAHLGWAGSIERLAHGTYKEVVDVGTIARRAREAVEECK